jgi:hypothetical protein
VRDKEAGIRMSNANSAQTRDAQGRSTVIAVLLLMITGVFVGQAPAAHAATADKFAPAAAPAGVGITISGTALTAPTAVVFLGADGPEDDVPAPNFIGLDAKKMVVQVPVGAATGPIAVTTADGTATTPLPFTVYAAPQITAMSAEWGKPDQVLTITGTNLLGAKKPVVTFGAKKASPFTTSTQTELQLKVPSGLPGGTVPLTVTTTGGAASSTFTIGPFVKSIVAKNGTTAGGTVASILGSGFTGVDAFTDDPATADVDERFDGVTIGGERVTDLIAVSDKEVIVKVPPGTDPAAPVVVTTKHGDVLPASGGTITYAYQPIPVITSISKNWNAVGAPSEVVLTGVNLTQTTAVTVGGLAPTSVVADEGAGTLTILPPVGTKAAVSNITVVNTMASGASFKAVVPFAYIAAPIVAKLTPATAPAGATVLITGANFEKDTTVSFGDTPATCRVQSFLALSCTAPAGTGLVDVTVNNGVGSSTAGVTTKFTHMAGSVPASPVVGLPVVGPLVPAYGRTGSTVELKGANLGSVTKIEFTGPEDTWVEAPHFLIVAPGRIVLTVPAAAVRGELRVTNASGRIETLGRIFTKSVAPSINTIDVVGDTSFGATPGDLLKIQGAGLIIKGAKTAVTIGGKPAAILAKPIPNAKTIVVRVPASVGGREPVVVSTPLGTDTAATQLYYIPEIKSIKPMTYSRAGGTIATIGGVDFTGVDDVTVGDGRLSAVTFGGVNVAKFVFMSDKLLIAVTAPGSASADDLVVTTQHDGRFGNSDGKTRSVDAPIARIDTVSPDNGPTGMTPPAVTLTGAHLKADSIVKFGSALGTVQSAAPDGTSMVVVPPSRAVAATVGITITNFDDGDELTTTKVGAYSYLLQPATITGKSASTATPGTSVTLSGTSFVGVTSVKFGTVSASYTVANDNTIYTTVPATPAGAAGTQTDITVVNETGQTSSGDPATADDWTWDNSPVLTSLSVSTGARDDTVTINGSNFVGVTGVRFGYTAATSYTVVDANTITAVVPATPVGAGGTTVDVVVEIGAFLSLPATPAADNWLWMAPANIAAMSHHTAPAGTEVTVTGTDFVGLSGATAVTMNNKAVTSYTVIDDTTLTFVVPPPDANGGNSAGKNVAIKVTNGSGLVSTANPATADDWLIQ